SVPTCGSINEVRLRPGIRLATRVAKADANGLRCSIVDRGRWRAPTLRPEIARLVAAAGDAPVRNDGPPALASVGGKVDGVLHFRIGRIARLNVSRGVNQGRRLAARRGQFERNRRRTELAIDHVGRRLRQGGTGRNDGPAG